MPTYDEAVLDAVAELVHDPDIHDFEEILFRVVAYLFPLGLSAQTYEVLREAGVRDLNTFFAEGAKDAEEIKQFFNRFAEHINSVPASESLSEFYRSIWRYLGENQHEFKDMMSLVLVAMAFVRLPPLIRIEPGLSRDPILFLKELSYWFLHHYRHFTWQGWSALFFDGGSQQGQIIKSLALVPVERKEGEKVIEVTMKWRLTLVV